MHNRPLNQAAGLMELAVVDTTKLLAVVSHGDEFAELPMLWRICSSLVGFGYSVTVLDGIMEESQENPGLEQMLDYAYWRGVSTESPSWRILPSRHGLNFMCEQAQHNPKGLFDLTELARLFRQENVLLVYSDARTLSLMLRELNLRPLLATSNSKTSLLTSYVALKRLLLNGKIEPTIANVKNTDLEIQAMNPTNPSKGLVECAEQFLNYHVHAMDVELPATDDSPCSAADRIALAMLEQGVPLYADWSNVGNKLTSAHTFDTPVRSH